MNKFISIEGIDGSGKTTQARLLTQKLKNEGYPAVFIGSKGESKLVDKIKAVVQAEEYGFIHPKIELLLYSACYLERTIKTLLPLLKEGKIVVVDRHLDSNFVYQQFGRGLDPKDIEKICTFSSQGVFPDITFLLDIPADTAHERIIRNRKHLDRIEKEGIDLFQKVRSGYLEWADQNSSRWVVFDGGQPKDEVHQNIWIELKKWI